MGCGVVLSSGEGMVTIYKNERDETDLNTGLLYPHVSNTAGEKEKK